ncbi:MAG: DNA cytosine methyltransferase [Bacteroidia bacterium]
MELYNSAETFGGATSYISVDELIHLHDSLPSQENLLSSKDVSTFKYNSVEAFAGGGGFLTGGKQAGFKTLLANDSWDKAIQTINLNHPDVPTIQREIQNLSPEEILDVTNLVARALNHFHGSWPCPLNSSSNTAAVRSHDPNIAHGFHWFIDKVESLQPEIATGENVEGIYQGWKKFYFDEGLQRIKKMGNYEILWTIIPCAYWGANNWRPRMFLLLKRKDIAPGVRLSFPAVNPNELLLRTIGKVFPHVEGAFDPQFEGHVKSVDNILPTMMATESLKFYQHGELRGFTLAEMKLAQTFPEYYLFPKTSRAFIWKLIGNAVPVETARRIMLHLRTTILDVHHKRTV